MNERSTWGLEWPAVRSIAFPLGVGGVLVFFSVLAWTLLSDPWPSRYHTNVQFTTVEIAISTAQSGIPGEVISQSSAGANLHGILSAPLVVIGGPGGAAALQYVAALTTLVLVALLCRRLSMSRPASLLSVFLIAITPQFVLFGSETMPEMVTLVFAVGALFGYLLYRETAAARWATASAVGTGLATLNHFWGGIALLTIFAVDLTWFEYDLGAIRRRRSSYYRLLILSQVPPLVVYLILRSYAGATGYEGYMIHNSWDVLLSLAYFERLKLLVTTYVPALRPTTAVPILVLFAVEKATRYQESPERLGQSGNFWLIWLCGGIGVLFLFPFGVMVHSYYTWWLIVPAAGLVGYTVDATIVRADLNSTARQLRAAAVCTLVLLVILNSGVATSDAVHRWQVDSDAPYIENGVAAGEAIEAIATEDDAVLLVGGSAVELAAVRARLVDAEDVTKRSFEEVTVSEYDIVLSDRRYKGASPLELVESFGSGDETLYLYRVSGSEAPEPTNRESSNSPHLRLGSLGCCPSDNYRVRSENGFSGSIFLTRRTLGPSIDRHRPRGRLNSGGEQ